MILKPLMRAITRGATIPSAVFALAFAGNVSAQTPTPIAAIQAAPGSFEEVTVEGVVTVPINYRGPTPYTGYIQDESGRGINVFGGNEAPPNTSALNTIGTRVRVTGEVQVVHRPRRSRSST